MMPSYPILSSTPIREAIIELRFAASRAPSLTQVESFKNAMAAQYPHHEPMNNVSLVTEVRGRDASLQSDVVESGFRLRDEARHKTIVALYNKLVIGVVQPYEEWPGIRDDMRDIYSIYKQHVRQSSIQRIGLRYINDVKLPEQARNQYQDHIFTPPSQPNDFSAGLKAHESVNIYMVDEDLEATVRQVISEPRKRDNEEGQFIPFLLDIDVTYNNLELAIDDDNLWVYLDRMRDIKNQLFFGTLKDPALEQYRASDE